MPMLRSDDTIVEAQARAISVAQKQRWSLTNSDIKLRAGAGWRPRGVVRSARAAENSHPSASGPGP